MIQVDGFVTAVIVVKIDKRLKLDGFVSNFIVIKIAKSITPSSFATSQCFWFLGTLKELSPYFLLGQQLVTFK